MCLFFVVSGCWSDYLSRIYELSNDAIRLLSIDLIFIKVDCKDNKSNSSSLLLFHI